MFLLTLEKKGNKNIKRNINGRESTSIGCILHAPYWDQAGTHACALTWNQA